MRIILLVLFGALSLCLQSQIHVLTGIIIDDQSEVSLSYATVQVHRIAGDILSGGGVSIDDGSFNIEIASGSYYAIVDYIGYEQLKIEAFTIDDNSGNLVDLGILRMSVSSATLDEVVVTAEQSTMEFALDKKIFNVGKDLGNAGGSAIELLNNIPSVIVDVEGNVKLRGSSNVRILIDGKPSGLVSFEGANGLRQLQSSLIEKVEVITNPSARYEAEGMAGIINIILKKERRNGFNGSFESTGGTPLNIGLAANLNYRHKKVNFFFNYGLNYRKIPSITNTYQEVFADGETFVSEQSYDGEHVGFFNNARGGLDYNIDDYNILTASYMYSRSKGQRLTDLYYYDYLKTSPSNRSTTYRTQTEDETEPIAEYVLSYKKLFTKKDREFNAEIRYFDHTEDSDQIYTQETTLADGSLGDKFTQTAPNDETERQWIGQVDYVHPFSEDGKLEAGFRTSFRDMTNDYVVNNVDIDGNEIPIPGLDNKFIYNENINAVYGIVGNKSNKFSYQFGLRAEWTDIETILEETAERDPRNYVNLFPSVHLTYELSQGNAIQWSYSRRVRRPVYNELSSYVTFSDNRNFFSGNPNLNPEYSDVIELGHIKYFEKGSIASSIYYRNTNEKIERIRTVDNNGFSKTFPENLNGENAYGAEFSAGYKLKDWWKLDFNFNVFQSETDGSNIDIAYVSETFSWFVRQTSRFTLAADTYLQLRGNYEAPQNIAQGRRKAIWFVDIAFNKPIFNKKGTLTFNIIDIFNTRKTRTITMGDNFISDSTRQRNRRQINLTVGYKLNQ
ncbi:MAG: ferric enterobactin receptor [Saprospiraceae bacterium]|jgi:ferric enterobactin receptor